MVLGGLDVVGVVGGGGVAGGALIGTGVCPVVAGGNPGARAGVSTGVAVTFEVSIGPEGVAGVAGVVETVVPPPVSTPDALGRKA